MGALWYPEAADWLRAVGLTVVETDGWESRSRSSGGFDSPPLGVQWHHTAGNMNLDANLEWQTEGSEDAPIGNMLLWDDGVIYMIAAGAANTAGKGGPITFSRGTVPLDKGNTTTWAIECANNGTGQSYPQVQIDAYHLASNTLNKHFGNLPSDLMTHAGYTDPSCPGRKVDPATSSAVQGPWKPRSVNSSGTWNQDDVRSEATKRAGGTVPPPDPNPEPEPEPPPTNGGYDWMASLPTIKKGDSGPYVERMQHLLAAAGFMNPANTANYDGVWGNGTDTAKHNFDAAHGLGGSDTSCGPKSWESLMTGKKW